MTSSDQMHYTLHELIILGREKEFIERLSEEQDLNSTNAEGLTLLHTALKERNLKFSIHLIERGADVNRKADYGFSPLHYALQINKGDYGEVRDDEALDIFSLLELLLKKGADVNSLTESDSSPLHFLISDYHSKFDILKVCRLFIENGANVNIMNSHFETPLYLAVEKDHLELAEFLIHSGANVNLGKYDRFPIIQANYKKDSPDMIKLLIDNGADVKVCENEESFETALSEQMFSFGNAEIVKQLLENGADVNSFGNWEESPLHFAVQYENVEVLIILLSYKPDINHRNFRGYTALHNACVCGNLEIVRLLIQEGAAIDIRNNMNQTALCTAAINGSLSIFNYIIKIGYQITDDERDFILSEMILEKDMNYEIADIILGNDKDINSLHREGKPLLYYALEEGNKKKVIYLLEKGADPESVPTWNPSSIYAVSGHTEKLKDFQKTGKEIFRLGENNRDPINLAILHQNRHTAVLIYNEAVKRQLPMIWNYLDSSIFYGNIYMASFFLRKGYSFNIHDNDSDPLLFSAVEGGHLPSLRFLIKKGVNVNEKNRKGKTALHIAQKNGHFRMMKILLKSGADLFVKNTVNPYFWEARYREIKILNLILKYTKNINALDESGFAPLHYFAKESSEFFARKLIRRGAEIHTKTKDGDTVIHLAVRKNNDIVGYFLELGADVNAQNSSGDTALHIAVRKSSEETIKLLLKNGADVLIKNKEGFSPLETAYGGSLRIQGMLEKVLRK